MGRSAPFIASALVAALNVISALAVEPSQINWTDFWVQVEKQSPKIQALRSSVEATRSELSLELPAPMIGVSSLGERGPVSGTMERSYEISQRVPFPGKFIRAGSVKQSRVDVVRSEAALDVQRFKRESADLFVALSRNLQEQLLLKEKQKNYADHLKRLRSMSVSDQVQKIHLLEIDAEYRETHSEILDAKSRESEIRRKISALMNQDELFEQVPLLEPVTPPSDHPVQSAPKVMNPSVITLALRREELASAEKAQARQQWLPDFTFTYRKRERFDNVMPSGHEAMIGLEIPFFWGWQPARKNQTSSALQDRSRLEALELRLNATTEIETLQVRVGTLWERYSLLKNELLPLHEKRVQLLRRITPSDMESLDLHKRTLEKWIAERMKLLDLESEFRRAKMALDIISSGEAKP